jgi:hypothetical protein
MGLLSKPSTEQIGEGEYQEMAGVVEAAVDVVNMIAETVSGTVVGRSPARTKSAARVGDVVMGTTTGTATGVTAGTAAKLPVRVAPPPVRNVGGNNVPAANQPDNGFVLVDGVSAMRIFAQVQAQEKCGKTHFCCTMPGPIAGITTDTGTEEVAKKFTREQGKKIFIKHIDVPKEQKGKRLGEAVADYEGYWNDLYSATEWVLANKSIRSLFFDTATEVWEILRLARFGKLTQVNPQHYGPVNREMADFCKRIYRERPDLNVIFVSKVKKEYKAMKTKDETAWNGKYERAGFGDLGYIARMNIELYYVRQKTETGVDGVEVVTEPGRFAAHFLDCGENPDCIGLRLFSPDLDFTTVALNVFPSSEVSDWE